MGSFWDAVGSSCATQVRIGDEACGAASSAPPHSCSPASLSTEGCFHPPERSHCPRPLAAQSFPCRSPCLGPGLCVWHGSHRSQARGSCSPVPVSWQQRGLPMEGDSSATASGIMCQASMGHWLFSASSFLWMAGDLGLEDQEGEGFGERLCWKPAACALMGWAFQGMGHA